MRVGARVKVCFVELEHAVQMDGSLCEFDVRTFGPASWLDLMRIYMPRWMLVRFHRLASFTALVVSEYLHAQLCHVQST